MASFSRNMNFRRRFFTWNISAKRSRVLPLVIAVLVVTFLFDWQRLILKSTSFWKSPEAGATMNLQHLRRNRKLLSYIDYGSQPLIEPSSRTCDVEDRSGTISLVALVTSAPHRVSQRDAIRNTWGQHISKYFFLGLPSDDVDETLIEYYIEAKQHGDLVVGNFVDTYHNLTLKTMYMLHWARSRCRHVEFLLKTDDDVLVNPWTMDAVLKDNQNASLIGNLIGDGKPYRDVYDKWYLPHWLYPQDTIPQFLSGTGYLINGKYLDKLYAKAIEVPLINLEDVYLTYLVAKKGLNLSLTHDARLKAVKPILPLSCTYWTAASVHSMSPDEMSSAWSKIRSLAEQFQDGNDVCSFFNKYLYWLSSEKLFH